MNKRIKLWLKQYLSIKEPVEEAVTVLMKKTGASFISNYLWGDLNVYYTNTKQIPLKDAVQFLMTQSGAQWQEGNTTNGQLVIPQPPQDTLKINTISLKAKKKKK